MLLDEVSKRKQLELELLKARTQLQELTEWIEREKSNQLEAQQRSVIMREAHLSLPLLPSLSPLRLSVSL